MLCNNDTGILGSDVTQYVNMVCFSLCVFFFSTNIHPSNFYTLTLSSKSTFSFTARGSTLNESTHVTNKRNAQWN